MKLDREQIGRLARVLGLLGFAWVLLRTAWHCDDAFISFRVVENVISGHGLRWNIAERVQVFTHPLWLLVHIPLRALTGEIYYTSLALSAALSIGTLWLLAWRVATATLSGVLVLALALNSRAFVDYSTSGLENPLTHLLAVLFFLAASRAEITTRTLSAQALLAGLIAWNRLDVLVVALPVLALSAWRLGYARAWKPLLAGFIPSALWFLFATVYYGHPLPNTAFAKLGAEVDLGELIPLGFRYFAASLREDPLTLATVAIALTLAIVRRRHIGIALGILLYLLYVIRIGGDFMGGRFFTTPFVLSLAILAAELSRLPSRRVVVALGLALGIGLAASGTPLTSGPAYGLSKTRLIDPYGVADERAYYFRNSGLWNGTTTTLPRDDKWLEATTARECGFPLVIAGAIGFYGYAAGPDLHILDYNALADPVLARLPAVENDELYLDWYRKLEGHEPATERRIGHFLRNIPPGYAASLLGDPTRFEDAALREFVDLVATATRRPLFSGERFRALRQLAFGEPNEKLDRSGARRYRPIPVDEILASSSDPVFTATLRGCGLSATDPEGAARLLGQAVDGCAANGLALKCLAETTSRLGRADLALVALQRLSQLAPEAGWVHADLARARLRAGDSDGALGSWERAVELNANFSTWWLELADARERAGDTVGAARARARARGRN